jgi:hypothetical protein
MGQTFKSERVTFGTKYGPCALEAAVRALIWKALKATQINDGLWVKYYLDDITVAGSRAALFVDTLASVAREYGFEFPPEKRNRVVLRREGDGWRADEFDEFKHLGVYFRCEDGHVRLHCSQKEPPTFRDSSEVTKREGFCLAGVGTDPLGMHPPDNPQRICCG